MTTPVEIIAPGIYPDMSNDAYHSGPGISKSGLDWIAKCPALFRAKYITREIEDKETSALAVGKAAHLAVFQPDIFDAEIAVMPAGIDRRTKAGKDAYEKFCAESAGKTIIKADEYEMVRRVGDAARLHPVAKSILEDGQAETSFFSIDLVTGELVKARMDWHVEDVVVDLKTILSASPSYFEREMWNRRYFVQAPYYLDVGNMCYPGRFRSFIFIAVEKEPPYLVECYLIDQQAIEAGRIEYRKNLNLYHQCRQIDTWPGYNDNQIVPVGIPAWAARQIDTAIAD